MELERLSKDDSENLKVFIRNVFLDSPYAMWFIGEPNDAELETLFQQKIMGIDQKGVIDIIAKENNRVLGECEIVKIRYDTAILGLLVDKQYRNKGIGSRLLKESVEEAKNLGINEIVAEVADSNKVAQKFLMANGFALDEDYRKSTEISGERHDLLLFRKRI